MDLTSLVNELRSFSFEKEWFEFKENWLQPAQLGEYISAISNSAAMLGRDYGYFVWGVSDDEGHEMVGTDFDPDCEVSHEPLKHYLARQLEPSVTALLSARTTINRNLRMPSSHNAHRKRKESLRRH